MKNLITYQDFINEKTAEEVITAIRNMFIKYGKDGIPDKDIKCMLKSSQWINIAGGAKKLANIWKDYIDPNNGFAYKKGKTWFPIIN